MLCMKYFHSSCSHFHYKYTEERDEVGDARMNILPNVN